MKQCESSSRSLPWGKYFCEVPQYENLKNPAFHVFSSLGKVEKKHAIQDFLEFLKGSFVLNHQRTKLEPFTVSRSEVPIRTVTVNTFLQPNYVHTILD
jgi:hypothetical protein